MNAHSLYLQHLDKARAARAARCTAAPLARCTGVLHCLHRTACLQFSAACAAMPPALPAAHPTVDCLTAACLPLTCLLPAFAAGEGGGSLCRAPDLDIQRHRRQALPPAGHGPLGGPARLLRGGVVCHSGPAAARGVSGGGGCGGGSERGVGVGSEVLGRMRICWLAGAPAPAAERMLPCLSPPLVSKRFAAMLPPSTAGARPVQPVERERGHDCLLPRNAAPAAAASVRRPGARGVGGAGLHPARGAWRLN